jgi:hypothetical protein
VPASYMAAIDISIHALLTVFGDFGRGEGSLGERRQLLDLDYSGTCPAIYFHMEVLGAQSILLLDIRNERLYRR